MLWPKSASEAVGCLPGLSRRALLGDDMDQQTAMTNAAQLLETLRKCRPAELAGLLDEIDMTDAEFEDTLAVLNGEE